ncbi:MAG: DNA polymerase IV [Anaerolineales bacterium]|nr:DNA polymerase IV [Anaerolineales bacterium]
MNKGDLPRTILHVDLDAFYCSVEETLQPSLRGKAFVVGGTPEGRGVVASASYAARVYGIHSAMPTAQALRLAPDLIVVSGRHHVYSEQSRKVMAILREKAPLMQQISIDEAFLDVTGVSDSGASIARRLQARILDEYQLPTSWGIASNKLVAKIATEVGKPAGLVQVPPGEEAGFLAPLGVRMLWGVGPKTQERLAEIGVKTIGDLAALHPDLLRQRFGEHGLELASRARGEDERPVVEEHDPRSISAERTFSEDIVDPVEIQQKVLRLSEQVARRLRKEERMGWTVKLKLRWPDFETITRQTKLRQPTDRVPEIFGTALALLDQAWQGGRSIRLIGVGVSDLVEPVRQLELFDRTWEEEERLQEAIDSIRERYGPDAVRRAGGLDAETRAQGTGLEADEPVVD